MSTVGELRAILAEAAAQVGDAGGSLGAAHERLDRARTVFEEIRAVQGDAAVPRALAGALQAVQDVRGQVGEGVRVIEDIAARL